MHINISTLFDVAIGLIFIFFVFSTFVSGIVELINSLYEKRTELLRKAIDKLLGSLANAFFQHKLTNVKEENFFGFRKPISYLSADSFSTVLIDLLTRPTASAPEIMNSTEQTFERIKQVLLEPDHNEIKELIRPILAKSDDLLTFKTELEKWYNGYMEQVSGWFKRYSLTVVRIVAVVVAVMMNVDTVYLANRLFSDNGFRERLVAEAIKTTEDREKAYLKDDSFKKYLGEHGYDTTKLVTVTPVEATTLVDSTSSTTEPLTASLTSTDSLEFQAAYVQFIQGRIAELKLPIGWEWRNNRPHLQQGQFWVLTLLGWLLTVAALSFGAPFWFDLLLKLVNVRNTARRPPGNPDPNK